MKQKCHLSLLYFLLCINPLIRCNDNPNKGNQISDPIIIGKKQTAQMIATNGTIIDIGNDSSPSISQNNPVPVLSEAQIVPPLVPRGEKIVHNQESLQKPIHSSVADKELGDEAHPIQASNEFADLSSSPVQEDTENENGTFGKKEKVAQSQGNNENRMRTMMPYAGVNNLDEAEDTHFLYYIIIFVAIIVCLYVISHNKKKVIGFIVEGRRPPSGSRRASLRYKRLSQHDEGDSAPTNVIY